MARTRLYNTIRFKRQSLTMEGPFTWRTGLEPTVASFRIPASGYRELTKIPELISEPADLEFYSLVDTIGSPDLVIKGMRIVDVEVGNVTDAPGIVDRRYAIDVGAAELDQAYINAGAQIIDYVIMLADVRETFQSPRGGRVNLGPLGTKAGTETPTTNLEVIEHLLEKMGINPQIALVPDLVNDFPPVRPDKVWTGHAPTELKKILDMMGLVLCPQFNGHFRVYPIGEGPVPDIPLDRALPELGAGIDRRGKTVVVSSEPFAIIDTVTITGPRYETWQFVAQDPKPDEAAPAGNTIGGPDDATATPGLADAINHIQKLGQQWLPLGDIKALDGGAIKHVRERGESLPEIYRDRLGEQLYRHIRLNTTHASTFPILRVAYQMLKTKSGNFTLKDLGLTVEAKIAQQDKNGIWRNSADFVKCTPTALVDDGRVIAIKEHLIQTDKEGASQLAPNARELADGDLRVTFSKEQGDPKTGEPLYYVYGLTQELGKVKVLSEDEARAAMNDPATVVMHQPGLRIIREQGKEPPGLRERFNAQARQLAEKLVRGSGGAPVVKSAIGFFKAELSGRVSEVVIQQGTPLTQIKVDTWWLPRAYYLAQRKAKQDRDGKDPLQLATERTQLHEGTAGATQPAVPLASAPPVDRTLPAPFFPVLCTVDGGEVGGETTSCTLTYKLTDVHGNALQGGTPPADLVKQTPAKRRLELVEYVRPDDGSVGAAYRDSDGEIKLYEVATEVPQTGDCEGE